MTNEITSVSGYKWKEREYNSRDALAIAQKLELPEIIGRILSSRGVIPEQAESFLKPTLREFLPDPFILKDMEKAAKTIAEYIINKNPSIAIFGDYDVDGATSSSLLVRYLRFFDINPIIYIPDRIKEGYGPNTEALLKLKEQGIELVITVDCGTMSFEPLKQAKQAGLDVIVIDHHKGDAVMPEALAIVNPNRFDESGEYGQIAACGVVFLLLVAINKILKEFLKTPDLLEMLDIVALGTVCDVVPLTGINRAFVTQGLKVMSKRSNIGIAALMDNAHLLETPTTYHAGYIIGPRINAGGRVGKSDLGTRLLTTTDALEAKTIAEQLNQFNEERRAIESIVQEEAMQDAAALPESDAVIIVARSNWHSGVIGIVAGRLKEHFHKPVAVIALSDGIGKSSARSVSGIDLGEAVITANHAGILLGGGGHAMAAGFSIAEDKISELREFFNNRLAEKVAKLAGEKTLHIDGIISLNGLNLKLAHLIENAAPFGSGNPSVRLAIHNVKIVRTDIIGDGHVRAIIVDSNSSSHSIKAMAFKSANKPVGQALLNSYGKTLHLAGQAKINLWHGKESVDFFIDDVAQ